MFLEGRKIVLKSPLDQHFHLVKMDNFLPKWASQMHGLEHMEFHTIDY